MLFHCIVKQWILFIVFCLYFQITPFHASLVLFIGKASGAVTDPVAGFFISKSRWTKIGRLMPW